MSYEDELEDEVFDEQSEERDDETGDQTSQTQKIPLSELIKERAKKREAQDENERLRQELEELKLKTEQKTAPRSMDEDEDDFVYNPLDPVSVKEFMKRSQQELLEEVESKRRMEEQQRQVKQFYDDTYKKYPIFTDDDTDVQFAAQAALDAALNQVSTLEDAEAVAEEIAKRFSRFASKKSHTEFADKQKIDPPPPSPSAQDGSEIAKASVNKGKMTLSDFKERAQQKAKQHVNSKLLDRQK